MALSTHGTREEKEAEKPEEKDKNTCKNESVAHTVIFVSF